jgi:hypothetical protein
MPVSIAVSIGWPSSAIASGWRHLITHPITEFIS